MKFNYIIYRSFDEKINCFGIIDKSTPRLKFVCDVEGEEIVYDDDTNNFNLRIGNLLVFEI